MCVIIDANQASLVFKNPGSEVSKPIFRWLSAGGLLIYGGKLARELRQIAEARRLLLKLESAGRARREVDAEVESHEQIQHASRKCRSNDGHVLALALLSGARVLVTEDGALMQDFGDPTILRPKGKVYRRPEHARLLSHRPGCRGYRAEVDRRAARRPPPGS